MAGNTRFHSKHHSQQHHSVRTELLATYPDAATDPLGSLDAPYQGPFYINGVLNVQNNLGEINGINYSQRINQFADAISITNNPGISNPDEYITSFSTDGNVEIGGNLTVRENLYVDKNVYLSGGDTGKIHLGDVDGDQVVFNAHVGTAVIPAVNNKFSLGIDQ